MSTEQSDLDEFDRNGPRNPKNTGRGTPQSEQADRPECGFENTYDGTPCKLPVAPGCERCQTHLDADESNETDEQDHGYILSATIASADDVDTTDETRCGSCGHPIPAMYRPMCPECGHRED